MASPEPKNPPDMECLISLVVGRCQESAAVDGGHRLDGSRRGVPSADSEGIGHAGNFLRPDDQERKSSGGIGC